MSTFWSNQSMPGLRAQSDIASRMRACTGRLLLVLGPAVVAVLDHGSSHWLVGLPHRILDLILWLGIVLWVRQVISRSGLRLGLVTITAGVIALATVWPDSPWDWSLDALACLLTVGEAVQMTQLISQRIRKPELLLPLSFLVLIALGTLLLKLPLASTPQHSISWLNALFTATSAACVTGLTVVDTAAAFSPLGQAILGILMMLGALGIIVFASVLTMLLGARLSLKQDMTLAAMLADQPSYQISRIARFVVVLSLIMVLAGSLAMMPLWPGEMSLTRRAGLSVFHAVSAFGNAGFALMPDSFESMRSRALTHLVILPLIVIGGLGFPVWINLLELAQHRWRKWRQRPHQTALVFSPQRHVVRPRLTLHSKLVLTMTLTLYLLGAGLLMASQASNSSDRKLWQHALDASFMSVTARTAGFTTVPLRHDSQRAHDLVNDVGHASSSPPAVPRVLNSTSHDAIQPAGRLTLMVLMFIGASPGGTGGGVKTTTIVLIVLTVAVALRRSGEPRAFGRQIHSPLISHATVVCLLFALTIIAGTLALALTQKHSLEALLFESISAATTTGLSLGITSSLTVEGKLVIIALLFLGRVGPLALLGVLLFGRSSAPRYGYAHEPVMLG